MKPEMNKADKQAFSPFTRRVLTVLGLLVLALFLWQIAHVLLLIFLGALLAIFLHKTAGALSARTRLPRGGALAVVGFALLALVALGAWFFGAQIAQQASQLSQQLRASLDQLRQYSWGQSLLESMPDFSEGLGQWRGVFSQLTGAASMLAAAITNAVLIVFLGIYLAVQPEMYERGIVALFPEDRRARVREVFQASGQALWHWLLAQLVSMVIVGVLTTVGLLLIGVRLALVLGLLAGVLEFIPFFGPFLSAIPAVLIAFVEGPSQALYVVLLYIGIQQVESNLITPIVQEKGASLPPVLTLTAAVGFGILFGPLGIIVATPLALWLLVLVKMLYVEDVLGSSTHVPGR